MVVVLYYAEYYKYINFGSSYHSNTIFNPQLWDS